LARTDSQEGDATAKTELTYSTTGGTRRAKPALGTLIVCIIQVEALHSLESREDYTAEKRRRERLRDVVEASREHLILTRVRIPVRAAAARASLDRLAPGVLLLPGMLTIEFRHPIELLEKLYGLAQAIGHDFERFEGLVPGGGK